MTNPTPPLPTTTANVKALVECKARHRLTAGRTGTGRRARGELSAADFDDVDGIAPAGWLSYKLPTLNQLAALAA
ncbi:hypothetical protein [Massilia psychrophila]|uniref:Uncharacterized protein n=1 Tax=Massilia psychrophila TaxID=1603353 RepID=A0A2G8SYC0_9BURK|nr:hypothetical protein [Massilia psychrophila]PIL38800.1 hypothetical protein CR103_15835 [Massilia psychrophila]GGE89714.1 hypothetical protein GCM10008020_38480 [Massilia psychrophila]